MGHDWEPYKEIVHKLYIVEKKSWSELHVILEQEYNFTPRFVAQAI